MSTLIEEITRTESSTYVTATCGKKSAFVGFTKYGVQVVCRNAMHKVWGGAGKHFATVADALAGYKSAEMKAIIEAAEVENLTKK